MNCPICGAQADSKYCPICGAQMPEPEPTAPVYNPNAYSQQNAQPYSQQSDPQQSFSQQPYSQQSYSYQDQSYSPYYYGPRKNSPMSIVALVLSLLTPLWIISLILGIIDIVTDRENARKHSFAIASIIISAICLLLIVISVAFAYFARSTGTLTV